MKNILVIDGNSILNRAFYGIRPLTTKDGVPTNALYGYVNILLKNLELLKPEYAVVAFDLKSPTFRHKEYSEYKAGRHAMPEELATQLPIAKRISAMLGFSVLSIEGYEADDIIGTVASFSNTIPDSFSYVLTGDRDSLQLINATTNILLSGNTDTVKYDSDAFVAKYGVNPEQFVDVKALMGDSSDNIPGVAGIGEKTAIKLISEFSSLDGVYENIDSSSIANGVRNKLVADKDNAYLSQMLARIVTNAPIGVTIDDIKYKGFDRPALLEEFKNLEFGGFIKRLGLDASQATSEDSTSEITEVTVEETTFDKLVKAAKKADLFALAVSELLGNIEFSVSTDGKSVLVSAVDVESAAAFVKEYSKKTIVYDSKNLFHLLSLDPQTKFCFDVKLAAYVADSTEGKYEPSRLALKYLG
ncbi:MAG: DNA polymerase I, partial [Clostridia bacterium]|nr:DNA polymerase I [Clostridia bacterium]